jgi:aryl-alcohol dehydrogenase-like predicted oxidoreductase
MIEINGARPIIERAIDLGVTFFDTANSYSRGRSEEILGEIVKERRDDLVIATKVCWPLSDRPNDGGLSRIHIMQQIQASLKRLHMDHVDLYQIHRWDYGSPIEETLKTLNDLVREGKVSYIGGSSMWAWQFGKALWTSDRLGLERFVSMQNYYNLCYREEEREMIPLCREEGIALIPWSPLARGFLSGKYHRTKSPESPRYRSDQWLSQHLFRPEDFDVLERAEEIAKEKDVPVTQLALSWLLHKGVTAPIIGATKVEHVEDAVGALELKLNDDEIKRLEEPYGPHNVMGHT